MNYYEDIEEYRFNKLNKLYQKAVVVGEMTLEEAEDMQHTEELMEKYEAEKWVPFDEYYTIKYIIKDGIHYSNKPIYLLSDTF